MDLKHHYYYFKESITKDVCEKIISLGEQLIKENKEKGVNTTAVTMGGEEKGGRNSGNYSLNDKTLEEIEKEVKSDDVYIRDSEVAWLNEQWIYDLILPYINTANESAGWKYEWDWAEQIQFTKYGINQFYGWHMDGGGDHYSTYKRYIPGITDLDKNGNVPMQYTDNINYIGKIRKLSLTLNLSKPEDYEGGNLKFDFGPHTPNKRFHLCEEIRPQGSIIVFPSHLYHQVTPVTKGTRYSLVIWCLGKPYK
jgi:PKHD-type hydroxylase